MRARQGKKVSKPVSGFGKWVKRGVVAGVLGIAALNAPKIAEIISARTKEGRAESFRQEAKLRARKTKVAVDKKSIEASAKKWAMDLTNSMKAVKSIYFGTSILTKEQKLAMDSLEKISRKARITPARVLQTIIINEKDFFNPNYQRLSVSEKMHHLGVHDFNIVNIGNAITNLTLPEKNALRQITSIGKKEDALYSLAAKERTESKKGINPEY
jgi:hypothetical protein